LAWAGPVATSNPVQTAALTRPAASAAIIGSAAASPASANAGVIVPVAMPIADEVIVHKAARRLDLMKDGRVLRSYRVQLGLVPQGPKERAGDFRTPEGRYYLARRNPRSDYFLSIQVSYPNAEDIARAHREHVDPGGSIMIHGRPNTLSHQPGYYRSDWTDGCIALSDSDMVEVWLMTRDNTPIEILP
ncbi:MAG: L,D-transpeptidase family protein, partial [Steroidobacteraceae bacterium]